jgi:cysteinyl-tRNA synthetase
MKLYNSLTSKKEKFETIKEGELSLYVCGPTVYNYIHIGNARPVVFFDVVKRYFSYLGYQVKYVSNITDIDDKIILEAEKLKINENDLTKVFIEAYFEDVARLGSLEPTLSPRATEYVPEIIFYIADLIAKGYAYEGEQGVYFRVLKVADYGKLSNQQIDELISGARIAENKDKENPLDFTLWKKTTLGLNYDSPWGKGRPGWHTECACMNDVIFNDLIDIHGGGSDLKFPHHENEISQAKALYNHSLARFWLHVGRLDMDQEKMSKSLGNIILVRDLLKETPYQAFRMLILAHHYRQPINYSASLMEQFNNEWERVKRALNQALLELTINSYKKINYDEILIDDFKKALNDDFNTANGLTVVFEAIKNLNKVEQLAEKAQYYYTATLLLSIFGISLDQQKLTKEQIKDYKAWQTLRKEKRYQEADEIRIRLIEAGIL